MKIIIIALSLFLASPVLLAATSIKAEVNGMVCAFCAKGIEKKLNAMPEGKGSFVSIKRRVVVLELKGQHSVPLEKFTQVIEEAGYSVSKVEKVEQSIDYIKAQLKANQ